MLKTFAISGPDLSASEDAAAPASSGRARRVCVYCGASRGADPAYVEAARALGQALAEAGLELVYGGGTDGLMGVLAEAVLAHGGRVTGIIPTFLTHQCRTTLSGAHDLIVVEHMHARKQAMFDKADAFIALPGGLGTLEELVEQMTWLKLGRHAKPLIVADIRGFWHPLLDLIEHMQSCGFLGTIWDAPFRVCRSIDDILAAVQAQRTSPADDGGARRRTISAERPLLVETAEIAGTSLSPFRHDVYPAGR